MELLNSRLKSRFEIHFAVKSNPHPNILKTIGLLKQGADVASAGELMAALDCGIQPQKIEFSGPGKTEDELAAAIECGIGSINVESAEELKHINQVSKKMKIRSNVGLRLNLDFPKLKSGLRMAG
ncbi:hypothetical protein JXJ21_15290 [candidate division KSB1 bacterium]|nr:hypothetical protein [candidate division KSB1 bacterium]